MANQRRAGQTFIGFQADSRLVATVDRARQQLRQDRSLFIREAVAEKLRGMGYDIPDDWVMPPMREVKDVMLNEQPEANTKLPARHEVRYEKPRRGSKAKAPNDCASSAKSCALSNNCPEACPILATFDHRQPKTPRS